MHPIERVLRRAGYFLRRRDLIEAGFDDNAIRAALAEHRIFRVRHGWYSVPDAPPAGVHAVRVGGRLTALSALESYGIRVPRRDIIQVAVVRTACRLRSAADRSQRLERSDGVRVHWIDRRETGGSSWRVSLDDALLAVLSDESRDVSVACASALLRYAGFDMSRLGAVFARAPARCLGWLELVSERDDSHGETFLRLWLRDAGVPCAQQARIRGVGRIDFRVGRRTFVEVNGGQHDPDWTGDGPNTWEDDHDRDTTVTIGGGAVLRYTYRQLYTDWPRVLAAIQRAVADDAIIAAYRARHPYRPRALRKRRTSAETRRRTTSPGPPSDEFPSFS
ncbi:MAG: type IV toxin-antitoxin system AbiEi family antitoxin domain-containing protein [Actinomycetota bacterium]